MCDKPVPEIPPQMRRITGECADMYEKKDAFFREVLEFLGYSEWAAACFTRTKYLGAVPLSDTMFLSSKRTDSESGRSSDTEIVLLIARNEILVASVIFSRDTANWVLASFAHYLNDPQIIERSRFKDASERKGDLL